MAGNLWTAADGLLDTHVSWSDLEEAAQQAFGKRAVMGEKKFLTRIGEGSGFMSNIAIANPDWQGTETEELPAKFVIKMTTCMNIMKLSDEINELAGLEENEEKKTEERTRFSKIIGHLHNVELYTYGLLQKHIKPTESLPILNTYFQKEFSNTNTLKGFIAFEYVDNVYPRHCYHNIKPSDLTEVLRTIAKLQAISLRATPEERKHLPNIVPQIYEGAVRKDNLEKIFRCFHSLVREEFEPVIAELKEFADQLTDLSIFATINDQLGMEPVFVHGDLWSSNIMWKKTENGIEFLKLIDYQMVHYGCPAEDFIRLFNSTLSGQEFLNNWEPLLEQFYGYLLGELGTERAAPYSLEQLKESYERLLPQSLLVLLLIIQPIAESGRKNNNDGDDSVAILQEKVESALTCMLKSLKKFTKKE